MRYRSSLITCGFCLIGAAFVVLASAGDAMARCTVSGRFLFTSAGPWPISLDTGVGEACGSTFGSVGAISFKRLYLAQPPQHGKITLRQGGFYQYHPAPGYRGNDNFLLKICGNSNGQELCTDLKFNVGVN